MFQPGYDCILSKYSFNPSNLVGTGAYSKVYKGQNLETKEQIAIKVIEKSLFVDPVVYNQTMNEITCMKKLNHPNIVKFYDVIQTDQLLLIVMEFCESGDLQTLIDNNKTDEAIKVVYDICKAYQELLNHKIIHRDLKPANIFKKEDIWKLGDFGFSLIIEKQIQTHMIGTPLYMSPEVLQHQPYNTKSDMWSLCMVFYEIIHGYCAWNADSPQDLCKNIFALELKFADNIRQIIKDFLISGLQKDQNYRLSWNQVLQTPLFQNYHRTKENHQVQLTDGQDQVDKILFMSEIKHIILIIEQNFPNLNNLCLKLNFLITKFQNELVTKNEQFLYDEIKANYTFYQEKTKNFKDISNIDDAFKELLQIFENLKGNRVFQDDLNQEIIYLFKNYQFIFDQNLSEQITDIANSILNKIVVN